MEDERPSLAFFDLASDEKQITPTLTLAFPDLDVENDVPWRIRLNLGSPIRNGPEFQARVPFVVNPSQQMLLILVFTVGFDNVITLAHSIAVPLSKLQNWTRENSSFMEWENWQQSTMDIITGNPCRFTFSMGSRFVAFDVSPIVETDIPDDPEVSIAFVRNLSPYHLMRTDWNPSGTHCQGVPGVWNTIALAPEISSHRYLTRIITESTLDIFMTEDNLIILEMVRFGKHASSVNTHPKKLEPGGRSRTTDEGFVFLNLRVQNVLVVVLWIERLWKKTCEQLGPTLRALSSFETNGRD